MKSIQRLTFPNDHPMIAIFHFISGGAYSINYNTDMLEKNLNADMTNPNVYHSIDDNFEDHVYDEIKAKENPGKWNEFRAGFGLFNIWYGNVFRCNILFLFDH